MFEYQPDQRGFHDFLVRVHFPREETPNCHAPRFEVQASLLTEHSPVFASMVDGPWRESHDRTLLVVAFSSQDFGGFLRCLAMLQAATLDLLLVPTPDLVRSVLPIANYYQVDALRDFFVESVRRTIASPRRDRYEAAADLALSVESALPASDPVLWEPGILTCINSRLFEVRGYKLAPQPGTDIVRNEIHVGPRESDLLQHLTRSTLQRCLENLCLRLEQTLTISGTSSRNYRLGQESLTIMCVNSLDAQKPRK